MMADDESVTPPEQVGPATESVPDIRAWQPQFDQLRARPHNPAAFEPAATQVPSPAHADPEAPSTLVRGETNPALRMATITQQEQRDHPQSNVGAGVQDGRVSDVTTPTPPAPQAEHLEAQASSDALLDAPRCP
jgi:hypothetical protein